MVLTMIPIERLMMMIKIEWLLMMMIKIEWLMMMMMVMMIKIEHNCPRMEASTPGWNEAACPAAV